AEDGIRVRNVTGVQTCALPIYNMFGQIPFFGIFLGAGSNEGLIGVTYEVVGTPSAPVLRVNPISALAPGLTRKIFEFKQYGPNEIGRASCRERGEVGVGGELGQ